MDGTVVDYSRTEASALTATHAAFFRSRVGFAAFAKAFHAVNDELWAAYRRHETDLDTLRVERFAWLLDRFGGAEMAGALPAVVARFEHELGARVEPYREAREALRAMCAVARLVLVTDGIAAVQHAKLASTRLSGMFDPVVISSEVGYRKPDPRLLRLAMARADVAREEALVVGDSPASDGAGAAAARVDFCWVNRSGARAPGPDVTRRFEVPDLATLAGRLVPDLTGRSPAWSLSARLPGRPLARWTGTQPLPLLAALRARFGCLRCG